MDFYQIAKSIDSILEKPDPTVDEMARVTDIIKDPAIRSYFLKRVTSLRWFDELKNQGFFDPSLNEQAKGEGEPGYVDPYRSVLDYLERVSKECSIPQNHNYALHLMEIIRQITRFKNQLKVDDLTWWYFVKIWSNLPTEVITEADVDLMSDWFKSRVTGTLAGKDIGEFLLPRFLTSPHESDWIKAAKIVDIITRIRYDEQQYVTGRVEKEANALIEPYWLRKIFQENASRLGETCGERVVRTLTERVREILPERDDRYSYIWRSAIEEHAQNYGRDSTRHVLVSALRDVLLAYTRSHIDKAEEMLGGFLVDPLDLLKRIGLYVVKEQYELHPKLFWEILKPELFNSNLRHELFELLKTHFKSFFPDQQDQIVSIIAQLSAEPKSPADDVSNAAIRLRWLEAIRGNGNQRVDQLYDEYLQVTGYTPSHPEFSSYIETGWAKEISPISAEQLVDKNIREIADYLKSYEKGGAWKEPTEAGLGEALKDAVKQKPDKFLPALDEFLKPELIAYQYFVISAFTELLRDKKVTNIENLLSFCLSIVENKEFWQASNEAKKPLRPTRSWITQAIADLIKAGTSEDQSLLEEKNLPKVETILFTLVQREVPTATGEEGDTLTEAINTPKGRSLEALFYYALYKARLYRQKKDKNSLNRAWKTIQHVFDHELEQCKDKNFEFSAMAGAYLLNLFYLSETWVRKNFNEIFSAEYSVNWRSALEGYAYVNIVNPDIYKLLKKHGHFQRALKHEFKNSRVREKIIQNITVGYLRAYEGLTGKTSLFAEILKQWRQTDISEVISFFWMLRDAKPKINTQKRILEFWKWCYKKIDGNEESNSKILSDLNLLAVFFKAISKEHKEWLLQSAPYVDQAHHSSFFLEYMDRLVNQSPREIAEIYLKMLTRTVPTYKESDVRSIVKKLYESGLTQQANAISNEYARRGLPDLLRDLFDQNNVQPSDGLAPPMP